MLLPGGRIADVGAGDGDLSRLLAADPAVDAVIATERADGPLRGLMAACAGIPKIEVRRGDGLAPLGTERLDGVAVLGMGARTILHILQASGRYPGTVFVLGPMQHAPTLRAGLSPLGLRIADERLASEGGRVYELIAAAHGAAPPLSWLDVQLGPVLRQMRPPGFDALCLRRIHGLEARLFGAKGDARDEILDHIRQLKEEYDGPHGA